MERISNYLVNESNILYWIEIFKISTLFFPIPPQDQSYQFYYELIFVPWNLRPVELVSSLGRKRISYTISRAEFPALLSATRSEFKIDKRYKPIVVSLWRHTPPPPFPNPM